MARIPRLLDTGNEPGTEPDDEPGPEPAPRTAPQYPDDEERIAAALRKMPPDTRTRLKRVNEVTKRRETHGILSPDEVSSEWIARRFGGGRYLIEVLERNDRGQEVVRASATWDIPGPYRGVGAGLPGISDVGTAAPAAAPAGTGEGGRVVTRELLDSAMASKVLDLLNRERGGGMDLNAIAALIGALAPLLTPLIERMLTRERTDPLILAQLAELKTELARQRAQPGPSQSALEDATRGIEKIVRLRELLNPDAGEGNVSSRDKLFEMLPNLVAAFTGRAPVAPAPEQQPAALAPANNPLANEDGTPNWPIILGQFGERLVGMASNGWEPEWCAELVQRALPGEYTGLMTELLSKPPDEARDLVFQAIPELRAYSSWVPKLLSELRTLMLPDPDAGEDE